MPTESTEPEPIFFVTISVNHIRTSGREGHTVKLADLPASLTACVEAIAADPYVEIVNLTSCGHLLSELLPKLHARVAALLAARGAPLLAANVAVNPALAEELRMLLRLGDAKT